MKKSFSYYLTMFIIKCKGLKKDFSTDPIDYHKIRKDDVKFPNDSFFKNSNINRFKINQTNITELVNVNSKKLILYLPGGAFISGPAIHHWNCIKTIFKHTNQNIWLCDYPKAPENKINNILNNITNTYLTALKKYEAENIIIVGDSAGATLALVLQQELIEKDIELPKKIILISPVTDPSFSNTEIDKLDKTDPILSKKGVLSAKLMCLDSDNLNSPKINPMFLSLKKFPETIMFIGENDIMYPDSILFAKKLNENNVKNKIIIGEGMPHIWPLLPVMKESKKALKQLISFL